MAILLSFFSPLFPLVPFFASFECFLLVVLEKETTERLSNPFNGDIFKGVGISVTESQTFSCVIRKTGQRLRDMVLSLAQADLLLGGGGGHFRGG